jgi:polyisoprenoid-binding protein YceI
MPDVSAVAQAATTYKIDSAHSAAQFKVRHMGIANVKGEFTNVAGTVLFDPSNPAANGVEAIIDASTISTRDAQRDGHLKSADFLEVETYPSITFRSKKIVATGKNGFEVTGDLAIHGVTREVVLTVEEFTPEAKDPWGNMRRGAVARTRINRQDYGLTWNAMLEAGGVLVGSEVELTIDVELVRV